MAFSDAPAEKTLAAITAGGAIVLARGLVPTNGTVGHHAIIHMADVGLCWHAFCRSHSRPTHHYHQHSNCSGLRSDTAIDLSTLYTGYKTQYV